MIEALLHLFILTSKVRQNTHTLTCAVVKSELQLLVQACISFLPEFSTCPAFLGQQHEGRKLQHNQLSKVLLVIKNPKTTGKHVLDCSMKAKTQESAQLS